MTLDIPAKLTDRLNTIAEHVEMSPGRLALELIVASLNAYDAERLTSRGPTAKGEPIGPDFRPGELERVAEMVCDGIRANTGDTEAQARVLARLDEDLSWLQPSS